MNAKIRFLSLFSTLMLLAMPAFALDLNSAKEQGLVGEMPNGLIGAVVAPGSTAVQELTKTVNNGRTEIYMQNAKQQNLAIDQVQVIAGEKLQTATPSGQYI